MDLTSASSACYERNPTFTTAILIYFDAKKKKGTLYLFVVYAANLFAMPARHHSNFYAQRTRKSRRALHGSGSTIP